MREMQSKLQNELYDTPTQICAKSQNDESLS